MRYQLPSVFDEVSQHVKAPGSYRHTLSVAPQEVVRRIQTERLERLHGPRLLHFLITSKLAVICQLRRLHTCDPALHKNSVETPLRFHTWNRSDSYSGDTMSTAFSFRLTPETPRDEKKGWPILSLILSTVDRTSVGDGPQTKPRLTGQDLRS